MNDNINAIIKDGKVYVANKGGDDFCKGCVFHEDCALKDFYASMCGWLKADNFKFSQELTDRLNEKMKDGTIEMDGKTYRPTKAEYGRCCEVCDIGQMHCSFECQRFEENENECIAMKLTDRLNKR